MGYNITWEPGFGYRTFRTGPFRWVFLIKAALCSLSINPIDEMLNALYFTLTVRKIAKHRWVTPTPYFFFSSAEKILLTERQEKIPSAVINDRVWKKQVRKTDSSLVFFIKVNCLFITGRSLFLIRTQQAIRCFPWVKWFDSTLN